MTRLKSFCKALGWQGGTIHMVAKETGCTVNDLLDTQTHTVQDKDGYAGGTLWTLLGSKSKEYIKTKTQGNIAFWIGVSDGIVNKKIT